jgi:hypothetical protein
MTARDPAALAAGWRDALTNRSAREFALLFACDGTFYDVERRTSDLRRVRPLVGRDDIERETEQWFASNPDFDYQITGLLSDGNEAYARWNYRLDLPDGSVHQTDGVTWFVQHQGEITEARVYFDSLGFFADLGQVPLPQ